MRQHLQSVPSVLAERFRFPQKRQGTEENIAGYVTELKRGDELNENMRDPFVCGIRSDVIPKRLYAESDDVTHRQAVKFATSLEAAQRDAAAVEARGPREPVA